MASSSNLLTARVAVSRTVVISGVLLRVGISGAALAVWAAVGVASAEVALPTAIAALVAGVAIAVLSLRRAWSVLDQNLDSHVDAERTVAHNRPRVATAVAPATR